MLLLYKFYLKDKISKFLKSDLFKTSFLNGIANIIKILTSLVSNKIVAVYLGPSGLALLGQFNNFSSIVMSIANVGIISGVTKYVSEYSNDVQRRRAIMSTSFYVLVFGSIITSLTILIGKNYFSSLIFKTNQYISIIVIFAITLLLFVMNSYLIALLNGFKQYKNIVLTNILSSIFSLLIAVIFVIKFGIYGAFLGSILSQTLIFFVALIIVSRSPWFSWKEFSGNFRINSLYKLLNYSLMAFATIFATTFIQLQIRTYIINHLSIVDAGYWQAISRICDIYLIFIITTLSIYYLPRLAELKKKVELRNEIIRVFKFILPLILISSLLIFLLKDVIIDVLFTENFRPMRKLFVFQLLGNVFKISSWLIAYLMVAKAMTKLFIITEIFSGILYYILTQLFISKYSLIGVTYSYCLLYFIYLVLMIILFRKLLFKRYFENE